METKISIITVCCNEQKNITKTLESVLCQQSAQFEYIVKDGGSIDRTNEIIDKYKIKFKNIGIPFRHIIHKDKGIYDAMNEAAQKCTGEYLLFINAGDILSHQLVIDKVIEKIEKTDADILYGDALMEDEGEKMLFKADMSLISKRMPFSHQACFINRKRFEEIKYDINYKICADYDFILKLYESNSKFQNINCIVCIYSMTGISSTEFIAKRKEHEQILKKHNLDGSKGLLAVHMFEAYFKTILSRVVPRVILNKLKYWYKARIKHYQYWDGIMY